MLMSVLAMGAALLLFESSAIAQQPARACVTAGVEPGEGRIAGCIKDHFKDLSKPCQNFVAATAAVAKACTADIKQHCADARRRTAKIACTMSTLTDLSDDCKSAVSQIAAARR